MASKSSQYRVIAENRKARHDYFIQDTLEAGIILTGTEVKSLRAGQGSIQESHAGEMEEAIYLFNAFIPEYLEANRFNHTPRRPRKLLLKRKEINKLLGAIRRKGITLVPLNFYFNDQGRVKVSLGLAAGKKQADKRAVDKQRDWERDKARIMRAKG